MIWIIGIAIAAIWMACGVVSYILWRRAWRQRWDWTRADRRDSIGLAFFGPIALFAICTRLKDELSQEHFEDLETWLHLQRRKIKRHITPSPGPRSGRKELRNND